VEPGAPDAVPLSSLRLVHDPATSTLFLADDAGPVGLAYLGLTPQYLLGGYLSWLVLLSDPWSRLPPFADHWTSRRRDLNGPLPDEVMHSERAVAGRLVTRRESWTFPAHQIAPLMDRDLTTTLLHMDDLRKQWGIPTEVFVHQHMPSQGATFDQHKPRYVDLTSPVSLLALRGWIDSGAAHISFVEALPQRPPVVALTATATERVRADIAGLLRLHDPLVQVTGFDRPNLSLSAFELTPKQRGRWIESYVRSHQGQSGIVYVTTRKGVDELSEEDKVTVARARRIEQFLSQNTYMAEKFTGVAGSTVPLSETIEAFRRICDGDYDHLPEQAFFNIGGIEDLERRATELKA